MEEDGNAVDVSCNETLKDKSDITDLKQTSVTVVKLLMNSVLKAFA